MPKPQQSDAAIKKATGKTWAQWTTWLDEKGGRDLDHKGLVAALKETLDNAWWRQAVAGGYERLVQGRAAHQMPKGFQVQASRTIDAPLDKVWSALCPDGDCDWMPSGKITVTTQHANKALRGEWSGGTAHPKARFGAAMTATATGKTHLRIQLDRLPDAEAAEAAKLAWRAALSTLKERLEDE